MDRRRVLAAFAALGASRVLGTPVGSMAELGFSELPDGTLEEQMLYTLPGKVPLIKKTFRPPNFETPVEYFHTAITPNRAFFVRWHLAGIPEVDAKNWTLSVGGDSAGQELRLKLDDLKKNFEPGYLTAVCLCSGNRRGLFEPHVPGVEWGAGAMGNALWRGTRLKDVLAKAGVKDGAIEVAFDGADRGVLDKTPDFVKSLPVDVALDENTLLAYEMNGEPLPHWNGFPLRRVVPGWTGTYWVKQLTSIRVLARPESNFWMSSAYRLPRGLFNTPTFASQATSSTEPITTRVVNSLVTSLRSGQQIPRGQPIETRGIAWHGEAELAKVEASTDLGASWTLARLSKDLGRFAFREFALSLPAPERGALVVMARATNTKGDTQTEKVIPNPAGYHHNAMQRIRVEVV
jgi:DMSO/TMAO reductase YedYZ molybdopterin-dependent catalytic subunit